VWELWEELRDPFGPAYDDTLWMFLAQWLRLLLNESCSIVVNIIAVLGAQVNLGKCFNSTPNPNSSSHGSLNFSSELDWQKTGIESSFSCTDCIQDMLLSVLSWDWQTLLELLYSFLLGLQLQLH
jgi:hypothetical protein